jgi:hypothetical protein
MLRTLLLVLALLGKIGIFSMATQGIVNAADGTKVTAESHDSNWWPLPPGNDS